MMLLLVKVLLCICSVVIAQNAVESLPDLNGDIQDVSPGVAEEVQTCVGTVENNGMKYDVRTCREKSLARSTWPSDHGDSSRTKYTVGAGLPKGPLNAADVKIIEQNNLAGAQWIYTYGSDSEYLFVMGGTIFLTYVAKLNSTSLELLQKVDLKPAMYIGGLLMHDNGNVYAVHSNTVTVFWNGDLSNTTTLDLPRTGKLNKNAVQTNGMVVSSDGYLVIKQWSFILEDVGLYLYALPVILKLLVACVVGTAVLVVFVIPSKSRSPLAVTVGLVVGSAYGLGIFIALFITFIQYNFGTFDSVEFVITNLLEKNAGGGGQLKFVDPISLEVVADLTLVERCSFGRMALAATHNAQQEDALVLIGDEFIRQYRWNPLKKVPHMLMLRSCYTKHQCSLRGVHYVSSPAILFCFSPFVCRSSTR
jgi:hypothetical protein